uniref:Uncharacterized protein n=1 Tax=Anguilla anguilla TaxID=7936 RepID=A0A0E9W8D2_ANGAN
MVQVQANRTGLTLSSVRLFCFFTAGRAVSDTTIATLR